MDHGLRHVYANDNIVLVSSVHDTRAAMLQLCTNRLAKIIGAVAARETYERVPMMQSCSICCDATTLIGRVNAPDSLMN